MQPLLLAAQAQPASGTDVDLSSLLVNWGRRLVGLAVLAGLLVLVVPAIPGALAIATETPPWARLGIGLAVAIILPLIGLLVFVIGLPVGLWWLGVILLALYPVLLLVSLAVSGLALGSWLSRRIGRAGVPSVVPFAVGLIVISLLSLLPFIGPIVNILAVIFGIGTLVLAPRSTAPVVVPSGEVEATPTVSSAPVAA
jgi:hypothetical protein